MASKAYKLFRYKKGMLYPLYVNADEPVQMQQVIPASLGTQLANGKVKARKLGALAFRPGWHLTEIPLADHIGIRQSDGRLFQAPDTVWCEVEYSDQIDYTKVAAVKGHHPRDQYLKTIPENGFYWYKTNSNASVNWLIAGSIKVLRILDQEEVEALCYKAGVTPQPLAK